MGQGYDDNALGSVVTSNEILDGTIANADISAAAEIAVSKLADGTARQLLQTDAAGTGVEFTSNVDVPGTLDVTGAAVFDSTAAVVGNAQVAGTLSKTGANGQATVLKTKTETVTFAADPGEASKATTGSIIPAGAYVVGVTGRVTVADTSSQVTSIDIGIAAKDTDAFADGIAVTLGTTFTVADGNSGADYSATSLGIQPSVAAQEITITGVGGDGNAEDLAVAITVHYIDCTAATS